VVNDLVVIPKLPPELQGWSVARFEQAQHTTGKQALFIVLEREMEDHTILRFEAWLHDVDEMNLLVPVIVATVDHSHPDLRMSVTRSKASSFPELDRHRRRLALQSGGKQ
jgi:hypothetical protein